MFCASSCNYYSYVPYAFLTFSNFPESVLLAVLEAVGLIQDPKQRNQLQSSRDVEKLPPIRPLFTRVT